MPPRPPMDGVEIPAIDDKVQEDKSPAHPGAGTPWEDRGNVGVLTGFFQTCFAGLRRPATLFAAIRRLETTGDANSFVIGCGIVWSLAILAQGGFELGMLHWYAPAIAGKGFKLEINDGVYLRPWIIAAVLAPVAVFLVMRLSSRFFQGMAATELRIKSPPILVHNVFAYALGPSLLAFIPRIGPLLAVAWIGVILTLGAVTRLRLSLRSAVTACIISYLSCVIALGAVVAVSGFIWKKATPDPTTKEKDLSQMGPRIRTR